MSKILVVDNYDSFVYNLVQYLYELGAEVVVARNDQIAPEVARDFDGILISPGPGTPEEAGISIDLIKLAAREEIPLLGVCLGHQAIGVAFGGKVSRAPELMHGKTSQVHHNGKGILNKLPTPFTATRYHSLAIEKANFPDQLEILGQTENGIIMAVAHKTLPISGVQYHPESVLTEGGYQMLGNWLEQTGDIGAFDRSLGFAPLISKN